MRPLRGDRPRDLDLDYIPCPLSLVTDLVSFCIPAARLSCFQMSRRGRGGRNKGGNKQELTEEQKQEIREAFDLFDTDGSGTHRARNSLLQSAEPFAGSCPQLSFAFRSW